MTAKTRTVAGPFYTRRKARQVERKLQKMPQLLPTWAKGCRVEKLGLFSYSVVATDTRGH